MKAYDVKELMNKFKDQGLELTEEAAKLVIGSTFDWLGESAIVSENKVDDFLVPVYPIAKRHALDMADKINKADNV